MHITFDQAYLDKLCGSQTKILVYEKKKVDYLTVKRSQEELVLAFVAWSKFAIQQVRDNEITNEYHFSNRKLRQQEIC